MKKSWAIIKKDIMYALVEKEITLLWTLNSAMELAAMLLVWLASDSANIGGYTKPELLGYYFTAFVLEQFLGWYIFWDLRHDIADGTISNFLVKPVSYLKFVFLSNVGYHIIKIVLHSSVSLIVFLIAQGAMSLPFTFAGLLMILPAMLISIAITFFIQFAMGCVTFFWTESYFVADLHWMLLSFFGGKIFPLSFFPEAFRKLIDYNPFRFANSFMIEILYGRVSNSEYMVGLLVGFGWVIFFVLLSMFAWRRGLKKYSAFGG